MLGRHAYLPDSYQSETIFKAILMLSSAYSNIHDIGCLINQIQVKLNDVFDRSLHLFFLYIHSLRPGMLP